MDAIPPHRSHDEVLAELVDVAGKRVVDVGCGSGALVRWLRGHDADVVGVECGAVMLRMAREADPDHLESYLEGVGQDLPLDDGEFDVVVYSYSLHHVPAAHMVDALREAGRVLRPDGTLYVVEPIAAGPGHEVIKLIDDETEVRTQAQAALDHAEGVGLELMTECRYNSRMVLDGADALIERVVGVDPRRAQRMQQHRLEFIERFNTLATPVEGGYALDQENRVKVFRKR
ncbi:MAG: methyltransferase domain-containing protein [Acidimicrobiales bacterium]